MYWPASLPYLAVFGFAQANGGGQQVFDAIVLNEDADQTRIQLSSIAAEREFTTLSLPHFPAHQVRVKKTDFCDPTVK